VALLVSITLTALSLSAAYGAKPTTNLGACVAGVARGGEADGKNDNHGGAVSEAARVTCWEEESGEGFVNDESEAGEQSEADEAAEDDADDSDGGSEHGQGRGNGHGNDNSDNESDD